MKKKQQYLQDREQLYVSLYGEEPCPESTVELSDSEMKESIAECECMLQHFIDISDQEEISFWRKMLQKNKVQRRELLNT